MKVLTIGIMSVAACLLAAVWPAGAQDAATWKPLSKEAYAATFPKDLDPVSRSRMTLIQRQDLDPARQKIYDQNALPDTKSLAGIYGPGGLHLHGSPEAERGQGLGRKLEELGRLVVAREMDQEFEWTLHEPVALYNGLEPATIDAIRFRKPLTGVPEQEAALIELGREVFEKHKVSSETYARAIKAIGERNLVDLCMEMGEFSQTAILLTTVDARLPFNRKPLLPVPYP